MLPEVGQEPVVEAAPRAAPRLPRGRRPPAPRLARGEAAACGSGGPQDQASPRPQGLRGLRGGDLHGRQPGIDVIEEKERRFECYYEYSKQESYFENITVQWRISNTEDMAEEDAIVRSRGEEASTTIDGHVQSVD